MLVLTIYFLYIKHTKFINSILIAITPLQIPWLISLFFEFFDLQIFSNGLDTQTITEDFLSLINFILSFLLHIILLPIVFLYSLKNGYYKNNFNFLYFNIIILVSFLVIPESINTNCVFYSCDSYYEDYLELNKTHIEKILYLLKQTIFVNFLGFLSYYFFYIFFRKYGKILKS